MMDLLAIENPGDLVAARVIAIHDTMLRDSPHLKSGNFAAIGTGDLARLFRLYDEQFFGGWLVRNVQAKAHWPLQFRLSSTMTRAGGKTRHSRFPQPGGAIKVGFEIAIASKLLFLNFKEVQRPIVVCGLVCTDRLQALQRIMEHEVLHLAEMLEWNKSSCSAPRFKRLAMNVFGHTDTRHQLVTPRELAAVQFSIGVGTPVQFEFAGRRLAGLVNRIQHRATVLVEAEDGARFDNGKRYRKYYVPLPMLRTMAETGSSAGESSPKDSA